jgi:nucleoside-diphosphate-sugar epimerase
MNVFLTGATGLLGGEVLVGLSRRPSIGEIHCLVRPKRGKSSEGRIRAVFDLHGDAFNPDQIVCTEGDLLDPKLGANLAANERLCRIDVVVHAAANTSFVRRQDGVVTQTNVRGLEKILLWARELQRLQTFLYVGTATICGADITDRVVREDESPDPQATQLLQYTRSKLEGELLVRRHLRPEQVLIARPSILLGDSRGLAPRSEVVSWAMAAMNRLRLIPASADSPLDIVPVDYASRAISELLFAPRRHDVYHVSGGIRGATSARQLSIPLARLFENLPDFEFVGASFLPLLRQWLGRRFEPKDELPICGPYLEHWTRSFGTPKRMLAVVAALEPYFKFMDLGQIFDNTRLVRDTGLPGSEPAHVYGIAGMKHLADIDVVRSSRDA